MQSNMFLQNCMDFAGVLKMGGRNGTRKRLSTELCRAHSSQFKACMWPVVRGDGNFVQLDTPLDGRLECCMAPRKIDRCGICGGNDVCDGYLSVTFVVRAQEGEVAWDQDMQLRADLGNLTTIFEPSYHVGNMSIMDASGYHEGWNTYVKVWLSYGWALYFFVILCVIKVQFESSRLARERREHVVPFFLLLSPCVLATRQLAIRITHHAIVAPNQQHQRVKTLT
jgi:hypothetical protein